MSKKSLEDYVDEGPSYERSVLSTIKRLSLRALLIAALYGAPKPASAGISCNDKTIIGFNLVSHVALAMIGAIKHKQPVARNILYGVGTGTVTSMGKLLVGLDRDYLWAGKILSNLGGSISANLTRGQEVGSTLGITIGPVHFSREKVSGVYRTAWYVVPETVLRMVVNPLTGYTFKPDRGHFAIPVYESDDIPGKRGPSNLFGNTPLIGPQAVAAEHEFIHVLQSESSVGVVGLLPEKLLYWIQDIPKRYHLRTEGLITFGMVTLPQRLLPYTTRPNECEAYHFNRNLAFE